MKDNKLISNKNTNEYLSESEITTLRDQFKEKYINEKRWNKDDLSFEQIMEIRTNVKWKNPQLINS